MPKRVLDVLARIDRELAALGEMCCLGRSQAALERELRRGSSAPVKGQKRTADGVDATAEAVGQRAPSAS